MATNKETEGQNRSYCTVVSYEINVDLTELRSSARGGRAGTSLDNIPHLRAFR